MKLVIMTLVIVLTAVTYTLHVSQTQATSLHMHELFFADSSGEIIHSDIFVEGADLTRYVLPEAPKREGYIFIGWSYDFTKGMPNADIIVYPQYICTEYNILATT